MTRFILVLIGYTLLAVRAIAQARPFTDSVGRVVEIRTGSQRKRLIYCHLSGLAGFILSKPGQRILEKHGFRKAE
ncbi:hypothetical protein [Phyllobacterium myrsinacearum]|uniref:Uncharacterized protein n=1 Tax=Phyllobacterium myrsinacearum TaxID=28101 RepID=A0A839EHS0_9HYPH|nr:hypothetical protein [Phyllobacterium myrsinacearum]MBA8878339.1 hypothetical protein [Phyllobacterium myrsinacearum]